MISSQKSRVGARTRGVMNQGFLRERLTNQEIDAKQWSPTNYIKKETATVDKLQHPRDTVLENIAQKKKGKLSGAPSSSK